jgi:hypothetical protein
MDALEPHRDNPRLAGLVGPQGVLPPHQLATSHPHSFATVRLLPVGESQLYEFPAARGRV